MATVIDSNSFKLSSAWHGSAWACLISLMNGYLCVFQSLNKNFIDHKAGIYVLIKQIYLGKHL